MSVLLILLWGAVHVMQWEHLLVHHLTPGGHHHHCHHHAEEPAASFEGEGLAIGTQAPQCLLCDWNWSPAEGERPVALPTLGPPVGIQKALGFVSAGHIARLALVGRQRRGPPQCNGI